MTAPAHTPETLGFETFLLGVGAQKAGTTWLYDYLASHPECTMPVIKELHVFDVLFQRHIYSNDPEGRLRDRLARLRHRNDDVARGLVRQFESRLRIAGDFDKYLDFFKDMEIRARLSGDITPTYSSLSAEHLTQIREMLIAAGLRVRVVFLMRDPVERYLSAVRMTATANHAEQETALIKRMMMRKLGRPQSMARTRYDETVRNLRSVFAEDELYIRFFENFFNEAEIRRLCDFLGIAYVPAELDKPPNPSRQDFIEFTDEERAAIYKTLKPVYDGCREIFGDQVPDSWMKAP